MQKKFICMLPGMECLICTERLDLFSRKCRRLKSDLREVYEHLKDMDGADSHGLLFRVMES